MRNTVEHFVLLSRAGEMKGTRMTSSSLILFRKLNTRVRNFGGKNSLQNISLNFISFYFISRNYDGLNVDG